MQHVTPNVFGYFEENIKASIMDYKLDTKLFASRFISLEIELPQ